MSKRGFLYDAIKALFALHEVTAADVLRVANRISDHEPLIMEAKVIAD